MKSNPINSLVLFGTLAMVCSHGYAQPCSPSQSAMLVPDDGEVGDGFGWSVAIDGDTAIVGSHNDDAVGFDSGSVYIYSFDGSGWNEVQKLIPAGLGSSDGFGDDVAISGNYLVVGAPGDDDFGLNSGAAYVFENIAGVWGFMAKLTPAAVVGGENFASTVDIDGDTIVIGASLSDTVGQNSGQAYIYRAVHGAWVLEATLQPNDIAGFDRFGIDVAVSGDRVIVGADSNDDGASNSGSAYIFSRSITTWTQQAKLLAADGQEGDQFGECVDISGDSVIIGARYDDDLGNRSGSAYIFEYADTAWTQHTKLNAFDGTSSQNFGQDVAIHNGRVIVGAWGENDASGFFNAGAAYAYSRTTDGWQLDNKLTASDQEGSDFYGYGVAVSDTHAIIGADGNDDFWFGPDVGSAYMIELNCVDACPADFTGDGLLNFFDVSFFISNMVDMNNDGVFNFFDVSAFLAAFAQGCP